MGVLEAIVLGAVQGLTEFLPISSSGHLVLMQHFLGVGEGQLLLDVMLHLGTVAAVVVVYRQCLGRMALAIARALTSAEFYHQPLRTWRASTDLRWVGLLIVGSVPTAVIGLLFRDSFEAAFASPRFAATMLIVTGVILQLPRLRPAGAPGPEPGGEKAGPDAPSKAEDATPTPGAAVLIGTAQGLAILPGISRSGSTISAALLLGVPADEAARFSFLLSIPAILGAVVLELERADGASPEATVLVAGAVTAFAIGWASLAVLLAMLRQGRFAVFSYYCLAIGIIAWIALTLPGSP
jgi:undecaprenyl-diphosphatase